MSGYLRAPSDDEPLKQGDPDTPIKGMKGATLGDIERRAFAHAAMPNSPDPGRTIH